MEFQNPLIGKGGGDFIYVELAKWDQTAYEKIEEAKNLAELRKYFDEMYEKYSQLQPQNQRI